jgi:hypothetical protein
MGLWVRVVGTGCLSWTNLHFPLDSRELIFSFQSNYSTGSTPSVSDCLDCREDKCKIAKMTVLELRDALISRGIKVQVRNSVWKCLCLYWDIKCFCPWKNNIPIGQYRIKCVTLKFIRHLCNLKIRVGTVKPGKIATDLDELASLGRASPIEL